MTKGERQIITVDEDEGSYGERSEICSKCYRLLLPEPAFVKYTKLFKTNL